MFDISLNRRIGGIRSIPTVKLRQTPIVDAERLIQPNINATVPPPHIIAQPCPQAAVSTLTFWFCHYAGDLLRGQALTSFTCDAIGLA